MSLKPCAKCGRMVSTKAPRCPKCGLRHPTAARTFEEDSPLLFSPDALRVPTTECPECHHQVREGAKRCPSCGLENPSDRPLRWRVPLAVAFGSMVAVAAWVGTHRLRAKPEVESGAVTPPPQASQRPARVSALAFRAHCEDPAPIYVFEAGAVPDSFIVVLDPRVGDPVAITKGFAKKYQLTAARYQRAESGFAARLSPSIVAGLRCEPAVKRLEEEPAKRYPERPAS